MRPLIRRRQRSDITFELPGVIVHTRVALADVMEAGGWKNEETLLRSYQLPDAETVKRVVLHPTQRIVSR